MVDVLEYIWELDKGWEKFECFAPQLLAQPTCPTYLGVTLKTPDPEKPPHPNIHCC